MAETFIVPILDASVTDGWSQVSIKCLGKDCDNGLQLNVLFENGYAAATLEDSLVCSKCGLTIGIAEHLRLQ